MLGSRRGGPGPRLIPGGTRRRWRSGRLAAASAVAGGRRHRARAEAAGDPKWAAEGTRVAVRSEQCRALRGHRLLRPVPAAPRAAASEAESRERE